MKVEFRRGIPEWLWFVLGVLFVAVVVLAVILIAIRDERSVPLTPETPANKIDVIPAPTINPPNQDDGYPQVMGSDGGTGEGTGCKGQPLCAGIYYAKQSDPTCVLQCDFEVLALTSQGLGYRQPLPQQQTGWADMPNMAQWWYVWLQKNLPGGGSGSASHEWHVSEDIWGWHMEPFAGLYNAHYNDSCKDNDGGNWPCDRALGWAPPQDGEHNKARLIYWGGTPIIFDPCETKVHDWVGCLNNATEIWVPMALMNPMMARYDAMLGQSHAYGAIIGQFINWWPHLDAAGGRVPLLPCHIHDLGDDGECNLSAGPGSVGYVGADPNCQIQPANKQSPESVTGRPCWGDGSGLPTTSAAQAAEAHALFTEAHEGLGNRHNHPCDITDSTCHASFLDARDKGARGCAQLGADYYFAVDEKGQQVRQTCYNALWWLVSLADGGEYDYIHHAQVQIQALLDLDGLGDHTCDDCKHACDDPFSPLCAWCQTHCD